MSPTQQTLLFALLATLLALSATGSAGASEPDWTAMDDFKTVYVLTTKENGDLRKTKVWMSVVDGTPFIRTSQRSRWGDDVERNPEITLRVEENDYPLRARFIVDAAERASIVAVFEAKYGSNPILNWFRGDEPRIMRLDPR
jgi:hypothetical protein